MCELIFKSHIAYAANVFGIDFAGNLDRMTFGWKLQFHSLLPCLALDLLLENNIKFSYA